MAKPLSSLTSPCGWCMICLLAVAPAGFATEREFQLTIPAATRDMPYSGRVYVSLVPAESAAEPRQAMHAWNNPPPLFSLDVADLQPDQPVTIDQRGLFHPVALDQLPAGTYRVQGVARVNPDSPKAGLGAGDLVSDVQTVTLDPAAGWSVSLTLDQVVPDPTFQETERLRLFEFISPRLSAFAGRDVKMRAGVYLPENFDHRTDERFPMVISITGFGGTHRDARGFANPRATTLPDGVEAIWVVPDASCFYGHSVFANSATNGPWGDALVFDLIPALEEQYRGAGAEHRYTTGVSSGGWSSLWLQIAYPDQFTGCWSHVPDPVELHAFQTVDVYGGDNMYTFADGSERPLGRSAGRILFTARNFVARETVLGPGGQIESFEAVWSPRMPDGTPRQLFDRATGAIDPETAEAWRAYDIAHKLRNEWDTIGKQLQGKIHVYAGSEDNFYLELAIPALQTTLRDLESDAVVEIIEGMTHREHAAGRQHMLETISRKWKAAKSTNSR
jgi:S-formylglutathione hydrolase FrmB